MRRRNLIILLASMLVVGMTVILLLRDRKRRGMQADAEIAFSRLATCLVGESGKGKLFTAALEDARQREAIDPRGTDWPKRCRQYTDEALRTHDNAYVAGVIRYDGSITIVADALDKAQVPPAGPLDSLGTLWTSVPSEVPQPRAPLTAAKITSLAPIHGVMPTLTLSDVDVGASTVHFIFSGHNDRDPPRVACELDAKLEGMTCSVPPAFPIFDVLARDRGVEPLYVKFDNESRSVVIDSHGNEIIRLPTYGYGFAFADGRIAVMSYGGEGTGERLVLQREASGAISSRSVAGIADRFRTAGSWVLWKERDPDDRTKPAKVLAFDVASADKPLDLGAVERRAEGGTSSGDCRSDTHLFVDLSPALAIRNPEKGWSMVEETPRIGNRTMSCRGDTLSMVDVGGNHVVLQTCTVAGCTKKETNVGVMPHDYFSAALGGDIVLVWAQGKSLYMMRAPIEKLADAPVEELVQASQEIVIAHPPIDGSPGGREPPPPPPSVVPTPDGIVVLVMGTETPTLSAVVVPQAGPARLLISH